MKQVIKKMRGRKFYILRQDGSPATVMSIYQFRQILKRDPYQILKHFRRFDIAAAGWFSEAEFERQQVFAKRAFRDRADNGLELMAMAGLVENRPAIRNGNILNSKRVETRDIFFRNHEHKMRYLRDCDKDFMARVEYMRPEYDRINRQKAVERMLKRRQKIAA